MIHELIEKIGNVEMMVNEFKEDTKQNANKIRDINSCLTVIDSMIEFYGIPNEISNRYNKIKQDYALSFNDGRVYYSVDRSTRIDNIVKEIDQFADITNYISETIEMHLSCFHIFSLLYSKIFSTVY